MKKCYSYIRFSSDKQSKGDSLRRQTELRDQYIEEHGLILDDTMKLRDYGISAFKGANRTKGALSKFLELIRQGKIERDSILLVESLDRLSREQVLDAFGIFSEIIRSGVSIVTTSDGIEYTEESLSNNFGQLIISIVTMSRSHEESKIKSIRIAKSWAAKRGNLQNKKLTAKCPSWLILSDTKDQFIEIPERVEIIKRIFKEFIAGKPLRTIERDFNREGIPSWSKQKSGWYNTYIFKILTNRAVIGEYQPHALKGEKRQPIGPPILNYYPQITFPITTTEGEDHG